MAAAPRLILASGSPRRRELLKGIGLSPMAQTPRVDEANVTGPAEEQVLTLARRKADAVAAAVWSGWVLGADTLGALDGETIGKPADEADAKRIIARLAGRAHEVVTGVVLLRCDDGVVVDRVEEVVTTTVHFHRLPKTTIDAYVATGEPMGKAGAYAIQGAAAVFVDRIEGSWSNVVGLPVHTVVRLLHQLDFPLPPHLRLDV